MSLLDRILPGRDRKSTNGQSVQFEIHKMTHRGGWKNTHERVYIDEPQPRPESDDDWWLLGPGRYRHIRRVDGRIDETIWMYETADAEEYYEQQREKEQLEQERARQRQEFQQLQFEEVKKAYFGETERFDLLSFDEISDRYLSLSEQHESTPEESNNNELSEEEQERARRLQVMLDTLEEELWE